MSEEYTDFEEIVIGTVDIAHYVDQMCPEAMDLIKAEYGSIDAYITEYVSKNDNLDQLYQLFEHLVSCRRREQLFMIQRYGLIDGKPKTLSEVARIFGITRERALLIESKYLRPRYIIRRRKRLRDYLDT